MVTFPTVDGGVWKPDMEVLSAEARKLGFDLRAHPVSTTEDLDAVFGRVSADGTEALVVGSSPLIVQQAKRIIDFANRSRLPGAFIEGAFVEAGGLFSYGSDPLATILQSLAQVDKILRGAKPQRSRSSCPRGSIW